MKMDKTVKWILIAVAIIVVIVIIIVAIKYFTKPDPSLPPPPPGGPSGTGNAIIDILSGLFSGDFFSNLFGGGKKCDPNNPGYQKDGTFNPAKCSTGPAQSYKCDCGKPGYTTDGAYKESCKEGRIDYIIDCQ